MATVGIKGLTHGVEQLNVEGPHCHQFLM